MKMRITSGLFDGMVLQRDSAEELTSFIVNGACGADGDIAGTVLSEGRIVLEEKIIGRCLNGKFNVEFENIPVGGPYSVSLKSVAAPNELLVVDDVLVGDVWILAGQSNMQGAGELSAKEPPSQFVRAFRMNDLWAVAEDPIHDLSEAIDPVHKALCGGVSPERNDKNGVGPGVAFGKEMLKLTGVPQGLLACAHGGTSMSHWSPALDQGDGSSLFGATARRLRKNGGKAAGVLWYQGENEAVGEWNANYSADMLELVKAFRELLSDDSSPFVIAQLARVVNRVDDPTYWNDIQLKQLSLQTALANVAVVPTIDLDLVDQIHLDAESQNILGRRLADSIFAFTNPDSEKTTPPMLPGDVKLSMVDEITAAIELKILNNVGHLTAKGRPSGFSLTGGLEIINTKLDGDTIILRTTADSIDKLKRTTLYYGRGFNPYCNILDSNDHSLPVFAIPLGNSDLSDFSGLFSVALLPRPYEEVGEIRPSLERQIAHAFPLNFCDSRELYPEWPDNDTCLFHTAKFKSPEDMNLKLLFGCDGPFSIWYDGDLVAKDPEKSNPAVADEIEVEIFAAKGEHSISFIIGANGGAAYGAFLRLLRENISESRPGISGLNSMPEWS